MCSPHLLPPVSQERQPRQAGAKALPNGAIVSEKDLENAMPTKHVGGSDSPTNSDGHKAGNPTLEVSRPASTRASGLLWPATASSPA